MKNDELGSRMKDNYEDRTRYTLPRRTYTVIRLDGKAFHTFTRGFERPYDLNLMGLMDKTAIALCESIQGVKLSYVQSDEISLIMTDFETIHTDAWFDSNVQKMASVSASIATAAFNQEMVNLHIENVSLGKDSSPMFDKNGNKKRAIFDSRVFTIPDRNEVTNYLIWRQQDATRNSIQMGAQALYSQKELNGKNTSELQELMFQKGTNWDKYPVGFKRGRIMLKEKIEKVTIPKHGDDCHYVSGDEGTTVERMKWDVFEPPVFTQDPTYLRSRLPLITEPIQLGDKNLLEEK